MEQPQPPRKTASPPGVATILGRSRGIEILWTRERFAEVIRGEVRKGLDHGWPVEQLRSWIHRLYDLDRASLGCADGVINDVTRDLRATFSEPDV